MNAILDQLMHHQSVRVYKDKPVADADLAEIMHAAQMAPSSINGQQVSVINITDMELRAQIMELAGDQPWIKQAPVFLIFCMDFYRASLAAKKWDRSFEFVPSQTALIVGTLDAGLMMQNTIVAAESKGLGTVPIGGINPNIDQVAKLLNLPDYVFPVCGLCIGYPQQLQAQTKPRLPQAAVLHENSYKGDNMEDILHTYDQTISSYLETIGRLEQEISWTQNVSMYYQQDYAPVMPKALQKHKLSK